MNAQTTDVQQRHAVVPARAKRRDSGVVSAGPLEVVSTSPGVTNGVSQATTAVYPVLTTRVWPGHRQRTVVRLRMSGSGYRRREVGERRPDHGYVSLAAVTTELVDRGPLARGAPVCTQHAWGEYSKYSVVWHGRRDRGWCERRSESTLAKP